jgi:F-type H+-transporting ATPase subunit alpha
MAGIRAEEISRIIKQQIQDYEKKVEVAETGTVLSVGDVIAKVYGLDKCQAGDRVPRRPLRHGPQPGRGQRGHRHLR